MRHPGQRGGPAGRRRRGARRHRAAGRAAQALRVRGRVPRGAARHAAHAVDPDRRDRNPAGGRGRYLRRLSARRRARHDLDVDDWLSRRKSCCSMQPAQSACPRWKTGSWSAPGPGITTRTRPTSTLCIGRAPRRSAMFLSANGFSGHGLEWSPAAGRAVARTDLGAWKLQLALPGAVRPPTGGSKAAL